MPKGMRDFFPEEMIGRGKLFNAVKRVYEKYGFSPMEYSALEELKYLEKESSAEIKEMLFRIEDSDLALRFDLTVPLARTMAENPMIPKPFKRYCIAPVWRREEPQKGRFREFWQADIDIVGSTSMACEAELLACVSEALAELKIDCEIIVNNRKILDGLMEKSGISKKIEAIRIIDKKDKIGEKGAMDELTALIGEGKAKEILNTLTLTGTNEEKIAKSEKIFKGIKAGEEGINELKALLVLLEEYGVKITMDFSLARGLDYYTGTIFEVKMKGNDKSIAGGGRYDSLIGKFGGPEMPAVGISIGIERIPNVFPKNKTVSEVVVIPIAENNRKYALSIAKKLRANGINVELDVMGRNFKKQLEYANKMGIPFAVIVGDREEKECKVKLKNLSTSEEKELSLESCIASFIVPL